MVFQALRCQKCSPVASLSSWKTPLFAILKTGSSYAEKCADCAQLFSVLLLEKLKLHCKQREEKVSVIVATSPVT